MQLPWALLQVHGQHISVAVGNAVALGFVAGAWATHLCWCIGHEVPGWPGYIAQAAGGANIEERTHLRMRARARAWQGFSQRGCTHACTSVQC